MDISTIVIFTLLAIVFIILDISTFKKDIEGIDALAGLCKYIVIFILFLIAIGAIIQNTKLKSTYKCPQFEKIEDAYRIKP